MQIREKGKKILCIRTEYKPELKRTVGVTVASFDKWLSTAPESVCQQLTKEEVDQLSKWLSERTENQSVDCKFFCRSSGKSAVCRKSSFWSVYRRGRQNLAFPG